MLAGGRGSNLNVHGGREVLGGGRVPSLDNNRRPCGLLGREVDVAAIEVVRRQSGLGVGVGDAKGNRSNARIVTTTKVPDQAVPEASQVSLHDFVDQNQPVDF
jgi:hypothetical protein